MDEIFLTILNMSLTASYVIAAIILARLILKKAPKVISYALWLAAGFRLVSPFSFTNVFSLIPFKPAPIPQDIGRQAVPRLDSGITVLDNTVSVFLPAAAPMEDSVNPLQIWLVVGSYLWLTGVIVMVVYSIISAINLSRRLRGAACLEGNIFQTASISTPFVLGLIRPRIYIPLTLTEEERQYIILHEQTHIQRLDHLVKLLAYLILCLHWFNPLVWVAFLLMGADMEMSCDERVLKKLGKEAKKAYSLSLLSLASGKRIIGGSPLAFGERGIKERVKNVLNFQKRSVAFTAVAVVLAVVLVVGFAMNRTENGEADNAETNNVETNSEESSTETDYAETDNVEANSGEVNNTEANNPETNNEGEQPPANTVSEADYYLFDTSYFEEIADYYRQVPDLTAAISLVPALLTIEGSYEGLRAVYYPRDLPGAQTQMADTLTEAGYVLVPNIFAELGLNPAPQAGDLVYYREPDHTFVSAVIEGDGLVVRYAIEGSAGYLFAETPVTGDGSGYSGPLFDFSYYDLGARFYQNGGPEPGVPFGIPPYRFDIEGGNNRLTIYYLIDEPDAKAEAFSAAMTAAGFQNNNNPAIYSKGELAVTLELEPDPSGFTRAAVVIDRTDAE
jgi:beta-lactamase regulating signal transducer with metallopeptidase domain